MSGLLDFFQSASNTVADNVAGPVDLISWGLRKAGVPVGPAPVGGSEWMRQQGLTRPVQQSAASLAGETAGLLAPTMIAAKAPQIAGGLLQMADNAMAPRTLHPQAGAIVWHGSPHKFDKFDSSKIGTGEGAQAYGHGLYLAENPAIAAGYQDRLSTGYIDSAGGNKAAGDAWAAAKQAVQDAGAKSSDHARAIATQVQNWVDSGKSAKTFLRYNQPPQGTEAQYKAAVDAWTGFKANKGSLYKVDLPDEAIAKMLDWDKPLSQQAPEVQAALQAAGVADINNWTQTGLRGSEVYKRAKLGAPAKLPLRQIDDEIFAADKLRAAGIPGIRYLDGGSRGAGAGTSNFVIFPGNEDILTILERNGKGLLGK